MVKLSTFDLCVTGSNPGQHNILENCLQYYFIIKVGPYCTCIYMNKDQDGQSKKSLKKKILFYLKIIVCGNN